MFVGCFTWTSIGPGLGITFNLNTPFMEIDDG